MTTGVNRGGGIWSTNHGSVTVTNSTISGNSNTAGSQGGGGIYSDSQASVTVTNSTISGNTAGSQGGGGIFYSGATLTLKSTILANNGSVNCFLYSGATGITDGYNLSDDNSCSNILTSRTDSNNTPAGLNPAGLQDNGRPTNTTTPEPPKAAGTGRGEKLQRATASQADASAAACRANRKLPY